MNDEDELDMFGDEIIEIKPVQLTEAAPVIRSAGANLTANWDDPEGYYREVLGEVLNDRYHVYQVSMHADFLPQVLGKGVFSSVVRAKDKSNNDVDVAIKIIRSNQTMYKAGLKERDLCLKLANADPDGKRHCEYR
jgi:serine/threonine-protein kinase PRP4